MVLEWKKFDKEFIENVHGKVFFYRDLYEGKHSRIFERAKNLIEKGEIVDNIIYGHRESVNVKTPYIIANISKLIAEIPATLVQRSIGNVTTSLDGDINSNININSDTDINNLIDGPENEDDEEEGINLQQEILTQIEKNSRLSFEHWGNIVQHQVDGGLVGVPFIDKKGIRIDFKARDVFYPHDDGLGYDLAYEIEVDEDDYLHVYREEVIEGDLYTSHLLYHLNEGRETEEVDERTTREILGINELVKVYEGRGRPFIVYWANEKTIMNPLGVSALQNQEGKQDDINWTLTRNAITFERNGKPRIAVTKEIMRALQEKALKRYGDEHKIDHRDLEITTFDEQGKAMEVIQIDVTKIGDIEWVKDLIKLMLMETQTSEKAVDFYLDNNTGSTQSGVAKFYDLFTSLLKAERIQQEYIFFLQELFEGALWLANYKDNRIQIETPEIQTKAMIPISKKEVTEENTQAYEKGAQSLETTVRKMNPNASEEWIEEELARIESDRTTLDSYSTFNGPQTLTNMLGNRDENGDPIQGDNE